MADVTAPRKGRGDPRGEPGDALLKIMLYQLYRNPLYKNPVYRNPGKGRGDPLGEPGDTLYGYHYKEVQPITENINPIHCRIQKYSSLYRTLCSVVSFSSNLLTPGETFLRDVRHWVQRRAWMSLMTKTLFFHLLPLDSCNRCTRGRPISLNWDLKKEILFG